MLIDLPEGATSQRQKGIMVQRRSQPSERPVVQVGLECLVSAVAGGDEGQRGNKKNGREEPRLLSTVDTQSVSEEDVPRGGSHVYLIVAARRLPAMGIDVPVR